MQNEKMGQNQATQKHPEKNSHNHPACDHDCLVTAVQTFAIRQLFPISRAYSSSSWF